MKSKKSIYVLLPLAIALWGYILYSLVSSFGGASISPQPNKYMPQVNDLSSDSVFDYKLNLNYTDPFLKTLPQNDLTHKSTVSALPKSPKPTKAPPNVIWPSIRFNGAIKNEKSNKKVYAIAIGGENFLVSEGDIIDKIMLKKVTHDSIYLEYENENRAFPR